MTTPYRPKAKLTHNERIMFKNYVVVEGRKVGLRVIGRKEKTHQTFWLPEKESKEHADWTGRMLAKALAVLVEQE